MADRWSPEIMTLTAKRFFSTESVRSNLSIECAFFSSLKMRNGTFKLTRPSRFAALETMLGPIVRSRPADFRDVLDIGVSTGLTTAELAGFLESQGAAAHVVGTDLFIEAHLVDLMPGFRVLADPGGWPLQYDLAGFGLRAWVRRLDYVTLAALPRLFARTLLQPQLRRRIANGEAEHVRMESRALAGRDIELVENDIFQREPRFERRFDLIRAANILNRGYFGEDRLQAAIANIRAYCRGPGALLLVVRSGGEQHDGTLFQLGEGGGFDVRARIGRGSEIEAMITGGTATQKI